MFEIFLAIIVGIMLLGGIPILILNLKKSDKEQKNWNLVLDGAISQAENKLGVILLEEERSLLRKALMGDTLLLARGPGKVTLILVFQETIGILENADLEAHRRPRS